ncbi:putative quinol monooxygenase [Diaminobutyricibacter sp. McL0608]|uniref:putative quinol monooxygenase n=1 Tax=Leifsonia sp. McL0608 TaxID=3143537 RepID=UPI0031F2FD4D
MSGQLTLYATFTAKPGQEHVVERLLAGHVERVRAEPGNVTFNAHHEAEDHRAYFVYEIYRDSAAFDAHIRAEHSRTFNAALAGLIEEDASQLTWLEGVSPDAILAAPDAAGLP